ncbi:MAG: hypothetical protein V3U72_04980 [Candidatus Aenigmarchaeota archaeon]
MGMYEINQVSGNLPSKTDFVVVTGGEPFSVRRTLIPMLHRLNKINNNGKFSEPFTTSLQTSGYWCTSEKHVRDTLEEIFKLGVHSIIFTGYTKHHRKKGVDRDKIGSWKDSHLEQALDSLGDEIRMKIETGPVYDEKVLPFGRAKKLDKGELRTSSMCSMSFYLGEEREISIDPDANVYLCCWEATPTIGSAAEYPIDHLIGKAENDDIMGTLMREGLKEAAKKLGVFRPEEENIYDKNPCSICEKVFSEADYSF